MYECYGMSCLCYLWCYDGHDGEGREYFAFDMVIGLASLMREYILI